MAVKRFNGQWKKHTASLKHFELTGVWMDFVSEIRKFGNMLNDRNAKLNIMNLLHTYSIV